MQVKKRINKKTGKPSWNFRLDNVIAAYVWLNETSTKFAKTQADHKFSVTAIWNGEAPELSSIRAALGQMMDEAWAAETAELSPAKLAKMTRLDYPKPELDKDTDEETGRYLIRASSKAYRTVRDPRTREETLAFQPLALVGPDLKPFRDRVYSGARLNLSVNAVPYTAEVSREVGLAFYLDAVQVIINGTSNFDPTSAFDVLESDDEDGEVTYSTEDKSATPFG